MDLLMWNIKAVSDNQTNIITKNDLNKQWHVLGGVLHVWTPPKIIVLCFVITYVYIKYLYSKCESEENKIFNALSTTNDTWSIILTKIDRELGLFLFT